jgi:hypothetical protein
MRGLNPYEKTKISVEISKRLDCSLNVQTDGSVTNAVTQKLHDVYSMLASALPKPD